MPKQKKVAPNWYIAAAHYLMAGAVFPIIGGLVVDAVLQQLKLSDDFTVGLVKVSAFFVSIYLGARYSSLRVNAIYVIADSKIITNLSTIYFIIITGAYSALGIFLAAQTEIWTYLTLFASLNLIDLILGAVVFFITSKKYISVAR